MNSLKLNVKLQEMETEIKAKVVFFGMPIRIDRLDISTFFIGKIIDY